MIEKPSITPSPISMNIQIQANMIVRSMKEDTLDLTEPKFITPMSQFISQNGNAFNDNDLQAMRKKVKKQIKVIKSETSGIGAIFYYFFHPSEKKEKQNLQKALEQFKYNIEEARAYQKLNVKDIRYFSLTNSKRIQDASQFILNNKDKLEDWKLDSLRGKIKHQIKKIGKETSGFALIINYLFHHNEYINKRNMQKELRQLKTTIDTITEPAKQEITEAASRLEAQARMSLAVVTNLSRDAEEELKALGPEQRELLTNPLREFIENEKSFLQILQEIETYKNELDIIIENPEESQIDVNGVDVDSILELRNSLERFTPIINVIASFVDQIKDLKLDQFPTFTKAYLQADFSPLLDIISMFNQFLNSHNEKLRAVCGAIKQHIPQAFNPKFRLTELDQMVAPTFRRPAERALTLEELNKSVGKVNKKGEKMTSVAEITKHAMDYARALATEVNERGRKTKNTKQ